MAAEWDNLIPDPRDMRAKNGSFEDELEGTLLIYKSRKVICVVALVLTCISNALAISCMVLDYVKITQNKTL